MNTSFALTILALAAAASLPLAQPAAAADCSPRIVQSHTHFPMRSQLRGQQGTVYLNVSIAENGNAVSTRLNRSSGYRLLDRAAGKSVLEQWVFDVSSCQRQDLPTEYLVAVEFRNPEYGN
jgi:TonB family protein